VLERWGRFIHRYRWAVLALSVVSSAASLWFISHGGAPSNMLVPRETESGRALELMHRELPGRPLSFQLLVSHPTLPASHLDVRAEIERALAPLRNDPRVAAVRTAWDEPRPEPDRISRDGRYTRVSVELHERGSAVESMVFAAAGAEDFAALRPLVRSDVLTIVATGALALHHDFTEMTRRDVRRAEMVILPVVPILLLLVFGSVVAAALPFGVGLLAVAAGLAATGLLAHVTSVSVYAGNVVTMIGLAVAIDYSLFLVSRFREEIRLSPGPEALARTLGTAGVSIVFSGLTVAVGLLGLYALRLGNMGSIGLAGTLVVFFAVLYSLTFLPALMAVLGRRVDAWPVPGLSRRLDTRRFWHWLTATIMAHPWKVLIPVFLGLLLLGVPFRRIELAASDVGLLPRGAESRRGEAILQREFAGMETNRVLVVLDHGDGSPLSAQRIGELFDYSRRLAADPAVTRVDSFVTLHPSITREQYQMLAVLPPGMRRPEIDTAFAQTMGPHIAILALHTPHPAVSDEAHALVRRIRADPMVGDARVLVTGHSAFDLDFTGVVRQYAPRTVAIITVVTYLALFLLLGSLLLPLKAVVMNFLSLSASYGALVWIFQDGHLSRWLHFTPGPIESGTPLIMFCVAFGLSMDYGVLLLSRIQEEYRRHGDNAQAVSAGLEHTGRIVTAAAAIMAAVFFSFALGDLVVVKAIGIGMGIAVVVDATVVRMLLVPATMRLLGRWNWWAPVSLTRWCVSRTRVLDSLDRA
jgi:RND superfamily putative drug exporter